MKYIDAKFPRELFESKIDKSGEHWLWTGYIRENGYGQFNWLREKDGRNIGAQTHQLAFELYHGEIPEDMEVGHTCEFRHCVRHIKAMTHSENQHMRDVSRRSRGLEPIKRTTFIDKPTKTHCKNGHKLTGDNIYKSPRGHFECKTCRREAVRRSKAKKGGEPECPR